MSTCHVMPARTAQITSNLWATWWLANHGMKKSRMIVLFSKLSFPNRWWEQPSWPDGWAREQNYPDPRSRGTPMLQAGRKRLCLCSEKWLFQVNRVANHSLKKKKKQPKKLPGMLGPLPSPNWMDTHPPTLGLQWCGSSCDLLFNEGERYSFIVSVPVTGRKLLLFKLDLKN